MIGGVGAGRLGLRAVIGQDRPMRSRGRYSLVLLIGSAFVASCSGTSTDLGAPNGDSTVESAAPTAADVAVGNMVVSPNPNNSLSAMVTVESPEPVTIELTATSGDHVVQVPRTASSSTSIDVPLVGLRSERDYELTAELFDESGAVRVDEWVVHVGGDPGTVR